METIYLLIALSCLYDAGGGSLSSVAGRSTVYSQNWGGATRTYPVYVDESSRVCPDSRTQMITQHKTKEDAFKHAKKGNLIYEVKNGTLFVVDEVTHVKLEMSEIPKGKVKK